jgi:hypothetical protein
MIVVDTNLLLYAYDASSEHHEAARAWTEGIFSGPEPVRLPWVVVLGFVRISTHARALATPFSIAEATAIVDEWIAQPNVDLLDPNGQHWPLLRELAKSSQVRGPHVTDAHIAVLCIEHGATLCTNDHGFKRYEGLRVRYPLEEAGSAP